MTDQERRLISFSKSRCRKCGGNNAYYEIVINGKIYSKRKKCQDCNYNFEYFRRKRVGDTVFDVVSQVEAHEAIKNHEDENKSDNDRLRLILAELSEITRGISNEHGINLCKCGCNCPVPKNERGRPRQFYNKSHKEKYYYNQKIQAKSG